MATSRPHNRLVPFASVTLAALAALLLALFRPGHAPSPAAAALTMENALLVTTRDRLRVCYESSPALAAAPGIASRLAQGLQQVRQHKDWAAAGLGVDVPAPEAGCSGSYRPPSGPLKVGQIVGPGRTAAPGPYRTAIVVLDDASARSMLGARPAAFATFELMCPPNTDQCAEVTSALLVREDFLATADFVATYLTLAVGLEPNTPSHGRFPLTPGTSVPK